MICFPSWLLSCCLSNLIPDVANLNSRFEERCIIISAARSRSSELRPDPPWLLPVSTSSSLLSNSMSSFCCWFSVAVLSNNCRGVFVNLLFLFTSCIEVVDDKSCCLLLLSLNLHHSLTFYLLALCSSLSLSSSGGHFLILILWPIDEIW